MTSYLYANFVKIPLKDFFIAFVALHRLRTSVSPFSLGRLGTNGPFLECSGQVFCLFFFILLNRDRAYMYVLGKQDQRKRRRIRREEKEKKVTRAGIESTAAAPSQPTRPVVSRSDHSAASKKKKKRLRDEL